MDVVLNVYDLSPYNYYVHWLGFGAYHSGLQLGGTEYSFGGNDTDGTGVYEVFPKSEVAAAFRQSILLGQTTLSLAERNRVLDQLRYEFKGRSYNILHRNCNHFTNQLSLRLLGRPAPGFVNRGARCISLFKCCLPKALAPPVTEGRTVQMAFAGLGKPIGGEEEPPEATEDRRKLLASVAERRLMM
jgi:hypothetical protein